MKALNSNSASKKKLIENIDPSYKIVGLILFIFLSSIVRNIFLLLGAAIFIIILNIFHGKGSAFVIKRFILSLPFGIILIVFLPFTTPGSIIAYNIFGIHWMVITHEGTVLFCRILFKFLISIYTLLLLSSTTPVDMMLSGFGKLKVPSIFITLIDFILRYFSLFKNEIDTMITARKARAFNEKRGLKSAAEIANIVGNALIRAFDRSLRVYNSMLSRGYDGEFRYRQEKKIGAKDYVFMTCFIILGLALVISDRSGLLWNMP